MAKYRIVHYLNQFFAGIGGASREGILLKGSCYLEALAQTRCVVFDKTGTLTEGSFVVSDIHTDAPNPDPLLEYAALAECASNHPISRSLRQAYGKEINRNRVTQIEELSGKGVLARVDGIPVAVGNEKLMAHLDLVVPDCPCIGTKVHLAVNGRYAGHIVIVDVAKALAGTAVAELKKAGIRKCVMLTGDNRAVAEAVAAELGMDETYSELLPADKLEKLEQLLSTMGKGEKLAYVGDGINDAPVLSRADIGIAMGIMGTDAAVEAADVVLMDDDPRKILKAIRISRKCMTIVKQNVCFALAVKFSCLALSAVGIANMWLAIFADVGVMILAVLNAIRAMRVKNL